LDAYIRGVPWLPELFSAPSTSSCFSNGGGIPLEHCTLIADKRTCALEYNGVR
jgi:hypothetical protein